MRSSAEAPRRRLRGAGRLAAFAALVGLAALAAPAAAERLLLLPAENLSGIPGAARLVGPVVERELAGRGWSVTTGATVEQALARVRVRHLDSLSTPARERLLGESGAAAYAAVTVIGLRTEGIPLAAIALRLVAADGRELFAEAAALTAEDTRGALELLPRKAVGPLTERVVRELCRDLPPAGQALPPRRPAGAPLRLAAPRAFRAAALEALEAPRRVVVLPLRNWTRHRDASRIVTLLTTLQLGRSGEFVAVETADLRRALVDQGVRDVDQIGPDELRALGERLGTGLFLMGTVYEWKPTPPGGSDAAPPEVEINLRLVDAATSRVLWTSHHRRRGSDYRKLLGLGAVTSVVGLADRAIGEMLAATAGDGG